MDFKKIIALLVILGSTTFSAPDDWYLEGDHVKLDDALVRYDVYPHTSRGGDIYVNFTSKVFSGNIDFAFVFDSDNMRPLSGHYDNGGQWTKLPTPAKLDIEYDGFDRAYVLQNIPIVSEKDYLLKISVYVEANSSGKYGIAFKPSSLSLAQAIAQDKFYYIDPWFNSSVSLKRRIDINGTGLEGTITPFPCLINGSSGFTVGGSGQQGIWALCDSVNGSIYAYYNDATDLQFTTSAEDGRINDVVIKGTSPNFTSVSDVFNASYLFLYLGENNGTSLKNSVSGNNFDPQSGSPTFNANNFGWTIVQDGSNKAFKGGASEGNLNGTKIAFFAYVEMINKDAHNNGMRIYHKWQATNNYAFGWSNAQPQFAITGASTGATASSSVDTPNGNHTLVGTWDGSTIFLYLDGVLNATAALSTTVAAPSGVPCVGSDILDGSSCNLGNYFPGNIHILGGVAANLSADWVKAFDEMMTSPSTMFTALGQETDPNAAAIGSCTATRPVLIYNFTFADESTRAALSGYDMDLSMESWTTNISDRTNATLSFSNATHVNICADSTPKTINATIVYSNSTSVEREYYLIANVTADSGNFAPVMYNLQSDDLTTTKIIVKDSAGIEKPNVVVIAQHYYVSINSWIPVSMGITDFSGTSVMKLIDTRTEDPVSFYRFILNDNNDILTTTPSTKLVSDAVTGIVTITINLQESKGEVYTVFTEASSSCSNTSDTLTCVYASTQLASVNLTVSRLVSQNLTNVCTNTSTSSTGTIQCAFGPNVNGTYLFTLRGTYNNNITEIMDSGSLLYNAVNTLGALGLMVSFLLTAGAALIGSRVSSSAIILGAVAGFAISALVGLMVLTATEIAFVVISGLVVMLLLRN